MQLEQSSTSAHHIFHLFSFHFSSQAIVNRLFEGRFARGRWENGRIWRCSGLWWYVTELGTLPLTDTASHRCDKGSSHERQIKRGAQEQTEGKRREKPVKTKFKVLMDLRSAFIPPNIKPSRVYVTASVYYPYKWTEGRVKPLVGESSTSIFIEWNWICSEDRPVLARLLSSLPALSDGPHRHLQNNHPNNTGSLQYVKRVSTPSPNQSQWKSQFSPQIQQNLQK